MSMTKRPQEIYRNQMAVLRYRINIDEIFHPIADHPQESYQTHLFLGICFLLLGLGMMWMFQDLKLLRL